MAIITCINIYYVTLLLCVVIGGGKFNRMDKPLKLFYFFLIIVFINEIIAKAQKSLSGNNAPVSHIYSIIELGMVSMYFASIVFKRPPLYLVFTVIIGSILLGTADLIFFESLSHYNIYMLMAECFIISFEALACLYVISENNEFKNIFGYPHFYISASLLILWSGTFFYWVLVNFLHNTIYGHTIQLAYVILNLLVYLIYMLVFIFLIPAYRPNSTDQINI